MFLMSVCSSAQNAGTVQSAALHTAKSISDKLMRDTRLSFTEVPQKEELGIQVIDWRSMHAQTGNLLYATRSLTAAADTTVRIAIAGDGDMTVWIGDRKVFEKGMHFVLPRENAYNRFVFQDAFTVQLTKGEHTMLVRCRTTGNPAVALLRPQTANNDIDAAVQFAANKGKGWMLLGPFDHDNHIGQQPLTDRYLSGGKTFTWLPLPRHMLKQLVVDTAVTYHRDPYAEWHYANGNTVWSVFNLAESLHDKNLVDFVKSYTGLVTSNMQLFEKQYDSLFAFRGSYHKLFRMSMLDDAGAAVLPFIQLYMTDNNAVPLSLLMRVANYIMNGQQRLRDGTFCRPEPVDGTVWADDLFMSVPFLLRMTKITGDIKYREEAVRQFNGFRNRLFDASTGLYRHGWFSATGQPSPISWGRANGWLAWATAELLEHVPRTHPQYPSILKAFREQVAALARYQEASGMWHQVLNDKSTYEETSCTAIFTLVMARGVRKGWIDAQYRENAINGWKAITQRIENDGTVHGICRGTEIGPDTKYYADRPTADQDPRGLGAVITAGLEISKLR